MGGGKSSSSSAPVVTEEQKAQLRAQTGLLTDTLIPAYQKTIAGAKENYEESNPYLVKAAKAGYDLTGNVAQNATAGGANLIGQGAAGLGALFDPNYEEGQVQASMQPAREAIREQIGAENAMFGGAGGAGSSRYALARENTKQLGEQRLATAAAGARAGVQANKAAAASSLMSGGGSLLNTGLGAAGQQLNMANAPMDLYSKYASIVYGTPGSGGGNYAGTQGSNTSSSGFGFKFS